VTRRAGYGMRSGAEAFVLMSVASRSSIPEFEAMSCGAPRVVTTDCCAMRNVAAPRRPLDPADVCRPRRAPTRVMSGPRTNAEDLRRAVSTASRGSAGRHRGADGAARSRYATANWPRAALSLEDSCSPTSRCGVGTFMSESNANGRRPKWTDCRRGLVSEKSPAVELGTFGLIRDDGKPCTWKPRLPDERARQRLVLGSSAPTVTGRSRTAGAADVIIYNTALVREHAGRGLVAAGGALRGGSGSTRHDRHRHVIGVHGRTGRKGIFARTDTWTSSAPGEPG